MTRCLIIASAAYIGAEMQAELGKLPPAFLPVGGRRLFVHQHAALKAYVDQVYLSLPEGFAVNVVDQSLLQDLKITPIFVPEGLTLGQSIVYVINVTAGSGSEIRILHGDTLVENVDASLSDAVSVSHQPPSGYDWGTLAVDDDETFLNPLERGSFGAGNPALTGYFSFSRPTLLVQEITRRKGDFVAGVTKYAETVPLTLIADCRWNDFGHIRTYYRSRRSMTTEREFNSLAQGPRYVEKSGTNPTKISAEANWFESLPAPMRCFTPSYLGRSSDEDPCWYRLEYLYQPTLTDLFVFGSLPDKTWDNILEACDDFLRECRTYKPVAEDVRRNGFDNALYGDKTLRRLIEYSTQSGCNLDLPCELNGVNLPSLREIAIASSAMITPLCYSSEVSFVHGDFCFSNIFYDFRSEAVRAIDPRGLDADNVQTCYGDIRYDIAKLFHSAVGYYDLIVAGYFSLRDHGDNRFDFTLTQHDAARYVATAFRRRTFAGLTLDQACAPAIGVQLFLSMLPLHKDDPIRQKALLANALRLFQELNSQNERHAVLETRVDL